jgi:hypothetical protein
MLIQNLSMSVHRPLLTIDSNWKQARGPPVSERLNKLHSLSSMGHCSALERSRLSAHMTDCSGLKEIMLNGGKRTNLKRQVLCDSIYIWDGMFYIHIYIYILVVLGTRYCLLGRCSITWVTSLALFCNGIFEMGLALCPGYPGLRSCLCSPM